ncbi:hypothetical protein NQ317_010167 [Molorchus minor]|uniref:RNA-directed DNA polymerase n=1 Tax=Molorchus minor TaxID=1323400 RepID=A0ABQ9IU31_9CUCU|nr:hypothetical protein NQ317_010167 [Molorchus minor]
MKTSYDEELLKEIEKRTQAKDETIGIYLAIMNSYFSRLTHPISEKNFKEPPPRRPTTLEPDLAYVEEVCENISTVNIPRPQANGPPSIKCFRCHGMGHKAMQCNQPRKVYCFRCNKEGFTVRTCPDCPGNEHARGDERPYLKVDILGTEILGLLDSGATCTVLGADGWSIVRNLGISLSSHKPTNITVANGNLCSSIGKCTVPMGLKNKLIVIDLVVIPDLPRTLILGQDFWVKMGIVPDLRSNEWHFSQGPELMSIEQIKDATLLSSSEKERLQALWYQKMVSDVQRNPLKFGCWRVASGRLFKYVKQDYPELAQDKDYWKVVVPKCDRRKLISSAHDSPTSGHMGVYKTYGRLIDKCYWPKMRSDVANYVRRCEICAAHKSSNKTPADMMISHKKADVPWEIISVDLMGPLPRSKRGNSFILVVTDYLSKFVVAYPLKKATTENVIKMMRENVFLIFGVAHETGERTKNLIFSKIFQDVKKRLEVAGKKSCSRYNLRRRYEHYKSGDMVWKRNYTLSNAANYYSAKLAPKFVGPYFVKEKVSPWTYILKDRDGKTLTGTWHIKDLKSAPLCEN